MDVDKAHVVVGRVRGDAVDNARHELSIDEGRRKHRQALPRYGRLDGQSQEVRADELVGDLRVVKLLLEPRDRGLADYPCLPVDIGLDVLSVRIHPDVGRPEDCLRAEGASDEPLPLPAFDVFFDLELDQVELLRGDALPLHPVVVARGALVVAAPHYGVRPLDHVAELAEPQVLPVDELLEGRVDSPELAPPVYREPRILDGLAADPGVVRGEVLRVDEPLDLLLRDAVDFEEGLAHALVPKREPVAHPGNALSRPVPRPGEEDVVALHPLEACVDVHAGGREAVPYVERPVHVWEGEGDEGLLPARDRLGLEDAPFIPYLEPVFLVLRQGLSLVPEHPGDGLGYHVLCRRPVHRLGSPTLGEVLGTPARAP